MAQIRLTEENERRLNNVQSQNPNACIMSLTQLVNIAVRDWLNNSQVKPEGLLDVRRKGRELAKMEKGKAKA